MSKIEMEVSTGALRTLQAIVAIITGVYIIHLIRKERKLSKAGILTTTSDEGGIVV